MSQSGNQKPKRDDRKSAAAKSFVDSAEIALLLLQKGFQENASWDSHQGKNTTLKALSELLLHKSVNAFTSCSQKPQRCDYLNQERTNVASAPPTPMTTSQMKGMQLTWRERQRLRMKNLVARELQQITETLLSSVDVIMDLQIVLLAPNLFANARHKPFLPWLYTDRLG